MWQNSKIRLITSAHGGIRQLCLIRLYVNSDLLTWFFFGRLKYLFLRLTNMSNTLNPPNIPCMLWGPTMLVAWCAGYSTLGRAMPSCSMTPCRSRWMSASDTWSAVRGLRAGALPSCRHRKRPSIDNRTAEPISVICWEERGGEGGKKNTIDEEECANTAVWSC